MLQILNRWEKERMGEKGQMERKGEGKGGRESKRGVGGGDDCKRKHDFQRCGGVGGKFPLEYTA